MKRQRPPHGPTGMLARLLAACILLLFAFGANAESGDAACFSLYPKSGASQGTPACRFDVAGNTPGGMGSYACTANLDRITRWCGSPPDGVPEKSCPVADPVYPGSGATTITESDFVSGGDVPLVFSRTYRAQPIVRPDAGIGVLWFHNWQRQLGLAKAGSNPPQVIAYRDDSNAVTFGKTGGAWRTVDGTPLALTQGSSSWTLTDLATGTAESYSAQGALTSVRTHNGHTSTLTYSDANTPSSVAPAPGLLVTVTQHVEGLNPHTDLTLRFEYDAKWRMTQMTDATGAVTRYGYDTRNNLVSVTWPDGYVRRYVYEDTRFTSALTGVIDETGSRIATWSYDAKGRATAVSHPDTTRNVQFGYGNGTTTVTDSQRATTLNFSSVAGVLRPTGSYSTAGTTSTTWDASGNLLTDTTPSGGNTEYRYDDVGRPVRVVVHNTSGMAVTSVRYADAMSLRPSMIASPGWMHAFVYDAQGNATGISELTTNDPSGANGFDASTAGGQQRTYGLVYDPTNSLNFVQVYVNGKLTEDWSGVIAGDGNMRSWTETRSGRVSIVRTRDAAHRPTNFGGDGFSAYASYDARGRVSAFWYSEQASPLNGGLSRLLKVTYGYSPDGRVTSRTGAVATNRGAETPIGSDEIDQWLDNYEDGVTPAGPPANLQGLVKALQFVQEPGLEPVCIECAFVVPLRWAGTGYSVARDPVWGLIRNRTKPGAEAEQCKPTQVTIDELLAAANEVHAAGQLMSKAGRAVTKHPNYFGFKTAEDVRQVYRTNEQLNNFASQQVKDILENGVRTEGEGGPLNQGWVTYTRSDDVAAAWTRTGEFIGFRGKR
jgi:YD repeat-containing protein